VRRDYTGGTPVAPEAGVFSGPGLIEKAGWNGFAEVRPWGPAIEHGRDAQCHPRQSLLADCIWAFLQPGVARGRLLQCELVGCWAGRVRFGRCGKGVGSQERNGRG
jgi:hypothetical protein